VHHVPSPKLHHKGELQQFRLGEKELINRLSIWRIIRGCFQNFRRAPPSLTGYRLNLCFPFLSRECAWRDERLIVNYCTVEGNLSLAYRKFSRQPGRFFS